MDTPTEVPHLRLHLADLAHFATRRLARRCAHGIPRLPHFDTETERQFWRERNSAMLKPLQTALLLGAAGFFAFVLLDAATLGLSPLAWIGRLLVVCGLLGLFAHLRRQAAKPATVRVGQVAGIAAAMATLNLAGTLLGENDPAGYATAWPGLLPIYFFTYGQMAMPLRASLVFGWAAMAALLAAGHLVGVEPAALLPSLLILGIVNLFGLCTRCQLETYSRNSFRQRRMAECAAEDKASFLRQTSHNLRQPLQALSCYSAVLDAALAQQRSDEARRTAAKLGAAIDELNESFNRILDIANLETGRQIPAIAEVEINPLLAALRDQFAPQAAQRGLALKVLPRTQPPFTVHSDATILRQILGNLLDNAIKYTASGWIMVATTRAGATRLKIHVRDSGIGIAADEQEDILKEFYRGRRGRNAAQVHGLGIGLAYVAKATERLPEHRLACHSQPNRGTDFSLTLPYTTASAPSARALTAAHSNVAGNYVFVVDGDAEVRQALAEQLLCWGCLVEKAGSLAEVRLALAESLRPPDLLISDFYLEQNETAHDVLAAIQADCGPVPAVILSARTLPPADLARWPETTQFLRKPTGATALLEAMNKAMDRRGNINAIQIVGILAGFSDGFQENGRDGAPRRLASGNAAGCNS